MKSLEIFDMHRINLDHFDDLILATTLKYLYIFESGIADTPQIRVELIHYLTNIQEIDETPISVDEKQEI